MSASSPRQPDTQRSIYYALGANVSITVVKFCGAAYTGSGALLAESLHSLADTGNQALLLLGRKQATAPATVSHPLGHGRATYFWAFIVTLLLFSLGGLFSIYEGYEKMHAGSISKRRGSRWRSSSSQWFSKAFRCVSRSIRSPACGATRAFSAGFAKRAEAS